MQENNKEVQMETGFSIFRVLYRNIWLIVIVTILGFLAGLGVAFISAKPTYTATKRVMFVAKYSLPTDSSGKPVNSAGNDMMLAKIYLPNAVDKIRSHVIIYDANEIYEGAGSISSKAVSASYGEESLIFALSYTDATEKGAKEKLEAIIQSAKINFPSKELSVAKDATLREVENRVSIVKNSNFENYLIFGALAGLVVSIVYLIIKEATDVTIRDREELEMLTGISLLASIDDGAIVEKRRIKKEKEDQKRKKKK